MYVRVPPQPGIGLTTGPVGVSVWPQLSVTTGGVGTVFVLNGQLTVLPPGAGTVNGRRSMVYVCVQSAVVVKSHAVYLYVHTTVPSQAGSAVEPTNTAFTVLPHASMIGAGAPGSVAFAGQATVDTVLAGGVNPPV